MTTPPTPPTDNLAAEGGPRSEMSEHLPTLLTGTCGDCGSTTTCTHDGGLGGEGEAWRCPVCDNRMTMHGSGYIEASR